MPSRVFPHGLFRRLFVAQTVSRWGDTFNAVAIVILVFQISGSGLRVAATVAFEIVPVLMLAPVAGVVADRFPKAHVMVRPTSGAPLCSWSSCLVRTTLRPFTP